METIGVQANGSGTHFTVSVPEEVRSKMGKARGVNWSAVACKAFTQALAELPAFKKDMNMDEVAMRLKASKSSDDDESFDAGEQAGIEWATTRAEAKQLERLESARDPQHDWSFGVGSSAYGAGEHFYFIIEPGDDGDRQAAADFWEAAVGDTADRHANDDSFVRGFAEGACDVWRQVQNRI